MTVGRRWRARREHSRRAVPDRRSRSEGRRVWRGTYGQRVPEKGDEHAPPPRGGARTCAGRGSGGKGRCWIDQGIGGDSRQRTGAGQSPPREPGKGADDPEIKTAFDVFGSDLPDEEFAGVFDQPRPLGSARSSCEAPSLHTLRKDYPSGGVPNRLLRGKPLGGIRPACARSPIQSFNSTAVRVKLRPDESSQVRPVAAAKTRTSETAPSL